MVLALVGLAAVAAVLQGSGFPLAVLASLAVGWGMAARRARRSVLDVPLRATSTRPLVEASYRIVSTDHEKVWRIDLRGERFAVAAGDDTPADGEARGLGL